MTSAKHAWGKRIGIAAIVFTVLGLPWAGLIWLAGGMSSVPKLSLNDAALASIPLLLSLVLAVISFSLVRSEPDARPIRRGMIVIMIINSLAVLILIITYFDLSEQRFLK